MAPPGGSTLAKHQATHTPRHVKVQGEGAAPSTATGSTGAHDRGAIPGYRDGSLDSTTAARTMCTRDCSSAMVPVRDRSRHPPLGGRDGYSNWQLLHRHCHDQKTAEDAVTVSMTTDPLTEEPGEGKLSRPVCAARRFVASLMQLGGTWRRVPGSPGLPNAKARGDECMPGKWWSSGGVQGGVPRDPRDRAKAGLLEAQSPAVRVRTHRHDA